MKSLALHLISLLLVQLAETVHAQTVPAPSRTVFKCEVNSKVIYSDSPCLGAQRLDIQPSRGIDKLTGKERIGADVHQERNNEQMAKALEPILSESPEQRAMRHRRAMLKPEVRVQCNRLDQEITLAEQAERSATKAMLPMKQADLLRLRQQYRDSQC